jgi:hypothetical protein
MSDTNQGGEDDKNKQDMLVPYSASGFRQGSSIGIGSWMTRPTYDVAIDSGNDEGMNHARPILYIS